MGIMVQKAEIRGTCGWLLAVLRIGLGILNDTDETVFPLHDNKFELSHWQWHSPEHG